MWALGRLRSIWCLCLLEVFFHFYFCFFKSFLIFGTSMVIKTLNKYLTLSFLNLRCANWSSIKVNKFMSMTTTWTYNDWGSFLSTLSVFHCSRFFLDVSIQISLFHFLSVIAANFVTVIFMPCDQKKILFPQV